MTSRSRKRKWEESNVFSQEAAIAEALAKIKTLRDCLKKERIYLEGLKNKLLAESGGTMPDTSGEFRVPADPVASTSSASCSMSGAGSHGGEMNIFAKKEDDSSDDDLDQL